MTLGRRTDYDIGETRSMALPPRPVRNRAGNPRYRRVKDENSIPIKVQDGLQPRRQVRAFAPCPLAPQFGDAVLYFRYRYDGQEQRTGMRVHPSHKCCRYGPSWSGRGNYVGVDKVHRRVRD